MKATQKKSGFENFQKSGVQNSHGNTSYFFEEMNKFVLRWNKCYYK